MSCSTPTSQGQAPYQLGSQGFLKHTYLELSVARATLVRKLNEMNADCFPEKHFPCLFHKPDSDRTFDAQLISNNLLFQSGSQNIINHFHTLV